MQQPRRHPTPCALEHIIHNPNQRSIYQSIPAPLSLLSSFVKPLLLFTEALLDSEEKVNVSPSRKARKVSICDVLAAPAEPDAPCDTPTKRAGGRGNEQTRKPESKPCTPLKHPGLLVMAALNQASQWALTYDRATEAQGARRRGRPDRSKTD
mgnify:FL=1